MDPLAVALAVGLTLGLYALLFRPLEVAFPARPGQPFFRPAWWLDLTFFLGQYLVWNGLVLAVLFAFRDQLDGIVPAEFRSAIASQPPWLQALEVIVISDVLIYWGHRLQHRVGFLWRFHSVHHSAEHLDWLAATANIRSIPCTRSAWSMCLPSCSVFPSRPSGCSSPSADCGRSTFTPTSVCRSVRCGC